MGLARPIGEPGILGTSRTGRIVWSVVAIWALPGQHLSATDTISAELCVANSLYIHITS